MDSPTVWSVHPSACSVTDITKINTRLYPAGQGSANRRYCHVMGKATPGNVVDTSQTARPFAGHFQPADTIISIGTFLQRFSKKSVQKCSETGPPMCLP